MTGGMVDGRTPVDSMVKALSGDIKFACSPSAISMANSSAAGYNWSDSIHVYAMTGANDICEWYRGNIAVSIADTGGGTAQISPAAGNYQDERWNAGFHNVRQ